MRLIERDKKFMNTTITIKVVQNGESTIAIQDAIDSGFNEFDRIVKQYTRFNQDSELSNLNRNGGKWVQVSDEFFFLIELMLELAEKSEGVFDPTIIDFLEVYGYDANYDYSKLENPRLDSMVEEIVKTRKSFKDIELNKETKSIKLASGQRLDLGGIGKGYAIDCAYEKIIQTASNFLIDAGGDIRANGMNEKGNPWLINLKHFENDAEKIIGEIELINSAIACSGSWARKFKQFHHLINPQSGKPENKHTTVYVKYKDATLADAWATTLFVGGEAVLKNAPKDLQYYLL
jgi:thiamine biosynthesis lipoprotein